MASTPFIRQFDTPQAQTQMTASHRGQKADNPTTPSYEEVRTRAIRAILDSGPVAIVGAEPCASHIASGMSDFFIPIGGGAEPPEQRLKSVLLVSPSDADWAMVESRLKIQGDVRVWALFPSRRPPQEPRDEIAEQATDLWTSAVAELKNVGRVPISGHRIAWASSDVGSRDATDRDERLRSDTIELLCETALANDPRTVWSISESLCSAQQDLRIYAQREIEHARSRTAEHERLKEINELKDEIRRKDAILNSRSAREISGREALRAILLAAKRRLGPNR